MNVKKKLKFLEQVLEAAMENISDLDDRVGNVEETYKPYSGAISMAMDHDEKETYYMVTDLYVGSNFLEFHHLIDDEGRSLTANSFPAKDPKVSIMSHMRNVYKSGRWSIVKEQILIGSFAGLSMIGGFSYTKKIKKGDYPYKFTENKDAVVSIKKEG